MSSVLAEKCKINYCWFNNTESADLKSAAVSVLNQPSLLIAPDISDTESAIPVRAIATASAATT